MGRHVFSGPTLSKDELRALDPDAQHHAPVAHGDLFRANLNPGDSVLIIDGLYQQVPSIKHKEILDIISNGVKVSGCSSMGALRAAELHPYGMAGTGWVFEAYASGRVKADDAVSVLHGPGPTYKVFTIPLVDIIATLDVLKTGGIILPSEEEELIEIISQMHYTDRTWGQIESKVASEVPALNQAMKTLIAFYHEAPEMCHRKHLDAIEGVKRHAEGSLQSLGNLPYANHWRTKQLYTWKSEAMSLEVNGRSVSLLDAVNSERFFDRSFPERWASIVLGSLSVLAAEDRANWSSRDVEHLSADQLNYWLTPDEMELPKNRVAEILSVRAFHSNKGRPWFKCTTPQILGSPKVAVNVVNDVYGINRYLKGVDAGYHWRNIRSKVLNDALCTLWNVSNEICYKNAAARDRGFADWRDALITFRPFAAYALGLSKASMAGGVDRSE